jgi:diaminopimelate epimerase
MNTMRDIPFAKFHGLHNDFIVCHQAWLPRPLSFVAKALTNRHTGVGADGLLVLSAPRSAGNDARLRFFNADGSEAEMSGNGIRCAAAFLLGSGQRWGTLHIETLAGVKVIEPVRSRKKASGEWMFRVAMGAPIFDPARIPFREGKGKLPIVGIRLSTSEGRVLATVTSMGNPHCSIFVPRFSSIDWRRIGAEIERLRIFPRRTNVEFVRIISREEVEVRYWERGVGETVSSGTGSCAAAVASILNGKTRRKVRVRTLAGYLEVEWPEGGEVFLTGPSEIIARGIYCYRAPRGR